jgi:uncharacterized protein
MFESATWLNPPSRSEVGAKKLKVWTADKTDFWRETHYGFTRHSGHVFGVTVSDDFTAQVRVEGHFDVEYDQAGIMVYVNDSTWLKAGAELADGTLSVSSVLTVGNSDWAVGSRLVTSSFLIRVTLEAGVLLVHASQDGLGWSLIRMAPFPFAGPFFVGPMCCSPNRSGLVVDFDSFEILKLSARDTQAHA